MRLKVKLVFYVISGAGPQPGFPGFPEGEQLPPQGPQFPGQFGPRGAPPGWPDQAGRGGVRPPHPGQMPPGPPRPGTGFWFHL